MRHNTPAHCGYYPSYVPSFSVAAFALTGTTRENRNEEIDIYGYVFAGATDCRVLRDPSARACRDRRENKARPARTKIGTGIKTGTGTNTRTGPKIKADKVRLHHVRQESILLQAPMVERAVSETNDLPGSRLKKSDEASG